MPTLNQVSMRYSDQSDPNGETINIFNHLSLDEQKQLIDIVKKLYSKGNKLLITYTENSRELTEEQFKKYTYE